MKAIAIIPARGGSKRIPHKNIKIFCGKPIIAYSIEAAKESQLFDKIIVSTDDEQIAEVARKYGAEVPFIRPANLSDNYIGTTPVVAHAVEWVGQHFKMPDLVCCIYPTAPFVRSSDIHKSFELIIVKDLSYVFSVTSYAFPVQRAIRINENGRVEMFYPEEFNSRSQDLEKAFHDAGQFYWGRADAWLSGKVIFSADSMPFVLPRERVQDIDNMEDWRHAELMFNMLQNR